MNDKDLQRLANMAAVKAHVQNILNTGRGNVPKPQLHKMQREAMKLDGMFVDLLLKSTSQDSSDDDEALIAKKLKEEKEKLAKKTSVKSPTRLKKASTP